VEAFSGQGRSLGGSKRPAPAEVADLSEEEQLAMALSLSQDLAGQARTPSEPIIVDEASPTTTLRVRMADGSKAVIKANHTHTVDQLKRHVASLAPGTADTLSRGGFRAVSFSHSSSRSSPQASPSRSREVSRQSRSRRGRLVARPFSYTPLMRSRSGSLIRRVASRSPTRSCSTRCSSSAPSDELDAAVGQAVLPRRHPTHRSCVASL